jgi:hypothetical protein
MAMVSAAKRQSPWTTSVTKNGVTVCGFNKRICDCCSNQSTYPVTFSGEKGELQIYCKRPRGSEDGELRKTDELRLYIAWDLG